MIEIPAQQITRERIFPECGEDDRLPRNWKYDLVAWISQGHNRGNKGHVATGGQDDVIRCDIDVMAVHGSHFMGERRSHGRFTLGNSV